MKKKKDSEEKYLSTVFVISTTSLSEEQKEY